MVDLHTYQLQAKLIFQKKMLREMLKQIIL